MSRTRNLRRQHDAAVALVGEIATLAETLEAPGTAYRVSLLLARLTGVLRIHFAQEDKLLYPHMIRSAHAEASSTAVTFQDEMGGLSGAFDAFAKRWCSAERLSADPNGFRTDAAGVFAALSGRIERENEVLYPLCDSIGDDQVARAA